MLPNISIILHSSFSWHSISLSCCGYHCTSHFSWFCFRLTHLLTSVDTYWHKKLWTHWIFFSLASTCGRRHYNKSRVWVKKGTGLNETISFITCITLRETYLLLQNEWTTPVIILFDKCFLCKSLWGRFYVRLIK